MEQRPVGGYVFLGTAIRYLTERGDGEKILGDGPSYQDVRELFRRGDSFEMHVTRRALWRLEDLLDSWTGERAEHSEDSDRGASAEPTGPEPPRAGEPLRELVEN